MWTLAVRPERLRGSDEIALTSAGSRRIDAYQQQQAIAQSATGAIQMFAKRLGDIGKLARSPQSLREDAPHLDAPTGQTLERLCGMARWLLDAQCGALVLHQRDVGRVIASSGLARQFRSRAWSFDLVGYNPEDRIVLPDASNAKDIQSKLRLLGLDQAGFYLRAPVIVEANHVLSLIIADAKPRTKPHARKMKLLDDLEHDPT